MNHVDICSGIGGFSLASRWMGWNTIAFCEIDKFCQKVLRKNFGKRIPIFNNLFTLNYASIKSFYRHHGKPAPRIGLVTAGLPCQPFSQAGKQLGRQDERHLFPAFLNFIRSAKPEYILVENVRRLLTIENGKVFAEIATSLESEGYEVITFCIPASGIEAPHERYRLWLVAHANGIGREDEQKECFQTLQDKIRFVQVTKQGGNIEQRGIGESGSILSDTERERLQSGWGRRKEFESFAVRQCENNGHKAAEHSSINGYAASTGLPDWAGGTVGQPKPLTEFERPNGREVEYDFRGISYGVPNRVDRLKSLGNSIVPQIAYEIFKAIEQSEI